VLERGSVEGQLFHSAAVAALASPPAPAERQLVALVRKELVRPDRPQLHAGDAYRFRHLLIRDAAYDALPKTVRADLHERFAAWLHEHGADLVERDEIVGYHLEQAYLYRVELGRADAAAGALATQASTLLAASGRAARLRGDHTAAVALLTRAAALDSSARLTLLPDLGELLFETGELSQAAAVLDEAVATARERDDEGVEAVASVLRALVAEHRGEPSGGLKQVGELATKAAAVLERLGDDAQLATVLSIGGRYRFFEGHARESISILERAQELALRAGDLYRGRECLTWIFGSMAWGPTPVSEALDLVDRTPDELRPGLASTPVVHFHDAFMHAHSGRFPEARASYAEGQRLCGELGMRTHKAGSSCFSGLIELFAGDPISAERVLREGFDELGELGEVGFRSTVGTLLAEALVDQGRDGEAEEVLKISEGLMAAYDCDPQVRSRGVRAKILAQRGRLAEAEIAAREGVELAARTDYLVLHGRALVTLASVLQAAGSDAEATAALREALELFERKENVPEAERTRELLAAAAAV
jgi:tetratricopeptide (TPR) repeat protein